MDWEKCVEVLKAAVVPFIEAAYEKIAHIVLHRRKKENDQGSAALTQALEPFGGRLELVTDAILHHHANQQRIQQFYAGAKLDWDIIVAQADIPRDQQAELLTESAQPFEGTRLITIVAEAGAGKSTLAWRVASELHRRHHAIVIRIKDNCDAEIWYSIPELAPKIGRRFYILVDDVFQDPEAADAFRELSAALPITILSTSRPNEYEYRVRRLKCQTMRLELRQPSDTEKGRMLSRLGKVRGDLAIEQQRRLDSANQFLVLMMELTGGKELHEIVRDTMEKLKALDKDAYAAYEHLCFAYRYSIATPVSLLERFGKDGTFHNLPGRNTTQGLIFWDSRQGCVRVGHPVIAESAAIIYEEKHSPSEVLNNISLAMDATDPIERRFFAHLLRTMSRDKSPLVHPMPKLVAAAVDRCVDKAERLTEYSIWRAFYVNCEDHEQARKCEDSAVALEPVSSADCHMLVRLRRKRGQERDAIPAILKCIKDHPEQGGVRAVLLSLVGKYGNPLEIKSALRETSAWLKAHNDDNYVRTAYLGFVERKGRSDQLNEALRETSDWLNAKAHYDDTTVRTAYLGFVERKGGSDQLNEALRETSDWLNAKAHYDDTTVRTAYLGFVECKGTEKQVDEALRQMSEWLNAKEHRDDTSVRTAYLRFVERKGSDEVKQRTITDTKAWLADHASAKEVWDALIAWLFRANRSGEAIELALSAVTHIPESENLLIHYLRAIQDTADPQMVARRYEEAIDKYPSNFLLRHSYAIWLNNHNYCEKSETYFAALVEQAPHFYQARNRYGELLLKLERWGEGAEQFREALKIHKGFQAAHNGLATALWKIGKILEAEKEFKQAIYWAGVQKQPQAKFYADLGSFYLACERWNKALEAFGSAKTEDPDYWGNYRGIGRAKMGLGHFCEAERAFRTALDRKPDLQPPASVEIQQWLQHCMQQLKIDKNKAP